MPIRVSDVLRNQSNSYPLVRAEDNQVAGLGYFTTIQDRSNLPTPKRTSSFIAVMALSSESFVCQFIGTDPLDDTEWANKRNWAKIANELNVFELMIEDSLRRGTNLGNTSGFTNTVFGDFDQDGEITIDDFLTFFTGYVNDARTSARTGNTAQDRLNGRIGSSSPAFTHLATWEFNSYDGTNDFMLATTKAINEEIDTNISTALGSFSVAYSSITGTPTIPVDLTSDGAGTIHANNVPTLNQNTTGTAAGLSSTLAVSSGGTGATSLTDNSVLTGSGTSAVNAEANLSFSSDRLTIGTTAEITPILRLINDDNTAHIAIADSADNLLTGVADGDLLIESVGDHSIAIGQNDVIQIKVTSSGAEIDSRHFQATTNTVADHSGDVTYTGGTTGMTAGALYYLRANGAWSLADADFASSSTGLLAIALGSASDTNGMLLRGMVTVNNDPGSTGDVLFVSNTSGEITSTAPSGNGDIVRVVGYCLDDSNGQIWFNPDGTFVEVSA